MKTHPQAFTRLHYLGGDSMIQALADTRVAVFGVGGVGSWCVEALARTGIGHITIIDSDTVAPSNINRQLPALHSTIDRPKVQVIAERILDINPECKVTALEARYTPENAEEFKLETYHYVIDAIDSLRDKADLILRCTNPATAPQRAFFSSMGAARKVDPDRVAVAEFWRVEGCPLARALRTRFRRSDTYPRRKFKCVYSPEAPLPQAPDAEANGTFAHITSIFGLKLASLLIRDVIKK